MYKNNSKNKLTTINLPKIIPDYKSSKQNKEQLTTNWLYDWIVSSKEAELIKSGDILPSKKEISEYLGISIGTVENAIRHLEDKGLLASKQRVGTYISSNVEKAKKTISKREITINKIKSYICQNSIGDKMPSVSKMAEKLNISKSSVRLAYLYLEDKNILSSAKNKKTYIINRRPDNFTEISKEENSLPEKLSEEIFIYLKNNFDKCEKIKTRNELANLFKVSIKTIHDSLKILENRGIIISRRGKYGTILINKEENILQPPKEFSIFTKSETAIKYRWEKIEKKLKSLIKEFYQTGSKLPSIENLSKNLEVSTNTIRQALKNLNKQGWVIFERGRWGGTFVSNISDNNNQSAYEWIAVNSDFINKKSSF